jgi:glutamine synthetase
LSIDHTKTKPTVALTTPKALPSYVSLESVALFEGLHIFSERELNARYQVDLEAYISTVQIESRTLGDMARNHIIPTAIRYQNMLIENIGGLKEIYGASYKEFASEQLVILEKISSYIAEINDGVTQMTNARKKANATTDFHKKALQYAETVKPFLTSIRYQCDKLELTVEDTLWPLAKYRELLFVR